MSTRKSSIFYGTLIGLSSLVVGMVLAARLDLTPASFARTSSLNVPAVNSAPITGPLDATTFRTIAHDQGPAVVSIIVTGKQDAPDMESLFGFQMPFGRNGRGGGGNRDTSKQTFQGAGSGFIIDGKEGYILTNNHVVENADDITVQLSSMKNPDDGLKAKVIGRDQLTDSALIQLIETPKKPLPEVRFGDSAQMGAGDWVMAIGNPFEFSNTVTVGVVSAVGRVDPRLNPSSMRNLEYIQTDAAINQGNSGGPLMNIRGEVVGINTAIITGGSPDGAGGGGNIGIGFAVPINTVREVLPQLHTGKVVRGRIGVQLGPALTLDEANDIGLSAATGAQVLLVEANGPAKAAGLRAGDVIIEYNGKPVKDNDDLVGSVTRTVPGTSVPVKIMRAGKSQTLTVKVEELNLDAEVQPTRTPSRQRAEPAQPTDTGYGMSIEPLTPSIAREASVPAGRGGALVNDVDSLGAAAHSGLLPKDIILSVNAKDVTSVADVTRELGAVPAGHAARILIWRVEPRSGQGSEIYLNLRKR